jgi:hypothetical protein
VLDRISGMDLSKQCGLMMYALILMNLMSRSTFGETSNKEFDVAERSMRLFGELFAKTSGVIIKPAWAALLSRVRREVKRVRAYLFETDDVVA